MAFFIIRHLRNLFDVNTSGAAVGDALTLDVDGVTWVPGAGGGGGGAPTNATYLVGAADATLTNEIVVGATPGGELGNTWASPTVDTVHSGSSHAATQAAAEATAAAALNTHVTDPTDAHDASAISNVPAGTIAATDVQAALNELDGQISTSLSDAVILAPASSARNVIQPTAGAVIAAIVKAHAAQSVDLTQWQDSAGGVFARLGLTGALTLQPTGDVNSLHLIPPPNTGNDSYVPLRVERPGGSAFYNEDLFDVELDGTFWITPPGESDDYYLSLKGNVRQSRIYTGAIADHALQRIFNWGAADPDSGKMSFFHGTAVVAQQTAASISDLWAALQAYGLLDVGSIAPSAGGAPTTATYITQTPDAGLSAEQALSALATGLVKNTTGTGVLSIGAQGTDYWAPGGTDVAVADGGTAASTAAGARTSLGLVIGTDVQAFDTELTQIAALADPNADRLLFWDDSLGAYTFLTPGTNLTITGTTIDATGASGAPAPDVQTFGAGAGQTWTKPSGSFTKVEVFARGAGGGGGSGRRGAAASVRCGGGGGGGACIALLTIPFASAPATLTVGVGAGGAGGAARTTDDTDGANGVAGGTTTVVDGATTLLTATGGALGGGGTALAGAAGSGGAGMITGGAGGAASGTGGVGAIGASANPSLYPASPRGGGAGGGVTVGNSPSAGGNGGGNQGSVAPTAAGANAAMAYGFWDVGPSGGGGGTASIVAAAGAGGTGILGSAGGGGGASLNGNNSGAGGTGGAGLVVVVCS